MTAFIATTTVSIARPIGAVDAWGDELATASAVASGLPAAITEANQRTYQDTEARSGVVEVFTIRLRPNADAREGDQITDAAGRVFVVDQVSNPDRVAGMADVRVTARRIAARSQAVNA